MLIALASLVGGMVLPGYCLTRRLVPSSDVVERAVYSVGLGLTAMATASFTVARLTGLTMSRPLVLAVALVIILACRPWRFPAVAAWNRGKGISVLVLLGTALALLPFTEFRANTSLEFLFPCLHELAYYLTGHDGTPFVLFDPEVGHPVTHVLSQPVSYPLDESVMLDEMRLANGAVVALFWALTDSVAVELITVVLFFGLAGGSLLVARAATRSEAQCLGVGLVTVFAFHGLVAYMVNETTFAVLAGLLMLALLTRRDRGMSESLAAGFLLGFAVGSRMAALAWLLPLVLVTCRAPRSQLTGALFGFLLSALPWLAVMGFVHGNPFFYTNDPSTEATHSLLGMKFQFRPLNWPFQEVLVRARGHLLPPLLYLPTVFLQSVGSVVTAGFLMGFLSLFRKIGRGPSPGWLALAWALPVTFFLLALAYMDYEKASWLLLGVLVMPLTLSAFLEGLRQGRHRIASMVAFLTLSVVLAFVPSWLAGMEVPVDTRTHHVVGPNTVPPPSSLEEQRKELGRLAVMPSFQEARHPGYLLDSLWNAGAADHPRSGRLILWQGVYQMMEARTPVETTVDAPTRSGLTVTDSWDGLRRVRNKFFLDLAIECAPTVEVSVRMVEFRRYRIAIDPGPPPHEKRYLALMVEYDFEDPFAGVSVELDGRPLPVTTLGYLSRCDTERRDFRDIRLVTNRPFDGPDEPTRNVRFGPRSCRFDWRTFGPEGDPEPSSGTD